ncbi:unnamed protein product [Choristocarpus tenellus]
MAPSDMAGLRETFESIDSDRSGSISLEELTRHLQEHVSGPEVEALYKAVNINKSAEINYNEFIAATMWTRIQLDEEKLHQAFEDLDRDGNGFLTAEGIRRVGGLDFDSEEINRMILEADVSGDGRVDYQEFAHLWKNMALERHHRPVTGLIKKVGRRTASVSHIRVPPR